MEKPNFWLFLVEQPALMGMQPQTEGLKDFDNSEGKDIRSFPELSAATGVFCSGLASMCWSKSCIAPGTGLQAELALWAHRQQCHQKDKKKEHLLYSSEILHIKKTQKRNPHHNNKPTNQPGWLLDYLGSIQKAGLSTLMMYHW